MRGNLLEAPGPVEFETEILRVVPVGAVGTRPGGGDDRATGIAIDPPDLFQSLGFSSLVMSSAVSGGRVMVAWILVLLMARVKVW